MAKLLKSAGIVAALLLATTAHAQSSGSPPSDDVKKLLAQALDAANQARDSEAKVRVLQTILSLEVSIGNNAETRRQMAALTHDDKRREIICEIAISYARKGDAPNAFAILRSGDAEDVGDWCYEQVAVAAAERGDASNAIMAAALDAELPRRAVYVAEAAQSASVAGKSETADKLFAFALETARTVPIAVDRIKALRMIAFELAEAHRPTEIAPLVNEMQSALSGVNGGAARDNSLSEIAEAQSGAGMFVEADDTIKKIKNQNWRDLAHDQLAFALINKGDLAGALKNIEMIEYEPQKANMAIELARARASRGDVAGALTIIGAASKDFGGVDPDLIYAAIAGAQGKLGKIEDGSKTARLITSDMRRARTLILLGAAVPPPDKDRVAANLFIEARAAALKIEELFFRAAALSHLAGVLSSRGEFSDARKAADAIPNDAEEWMADDVEKHKGHAFENIAYWQCKMGNCKDALQCAAVEGSPLFRSFAIVGVVEAMLGLEPPSDHYGEEGYG